MTQEMIYHPSIADLEEKVSYGTLGVLDCLAKRTWENEVVKRNVLLINGGTIVRNCYSDAKDNDNDKIFNAISYDFMQLRNQFEAYVSGEAHMLVYFQPGITELIPEVSRKKQTDNRMNIERLTRAVVASEQLKPNIVTKLNAHGNVTYYGLYSSGTFAYRMLKHAIRSIMNGKIPKIFLMSHCPIDFLIMDDFAVIDIISSHTGVLVGKSDLSMKVFQNDAIPFNRITYKLFGDKDFVKAICRNRPKAMELLKNTNLRLKTEREIVALAKTKLGIDPNLLKWDI